VLHHGTVTTLGNLSIAVVLQFQLLNTDYADFQHVVDKAIVIENKIKEMEKDGKRKVSFHG
jgi:hypothetical protein